MYFVLYKIISFSLQYLHLLFVLVILLMLKCSGLLFSIYLIYCIEVFKVMWCTTVDLYTLSAQLSFLCINLHKETRVVLVFIRGVDIFFI